MRRVLDWFRPRNAKTTIIAYFAMTVAALAAIVTANDIATAIQVSSTTPDFMKQNAYLFASMAVNQESSYKRGYTSDTTAHNSCCWGVLQLNWKYNSKYFGTSSPQAYAAEPLQDQIDAYGNYFNANLNSSSTQWMMSHMGQQLGPNTIDAAMVFSCIQIGVGNCQKAINAGTCAAARDGSGVSMCKYADHANEPSNCTDASVCTKNGSAGTGGGNSGGGTTGGGNGGGGTGPGTGGGYGGGGTGGGVDGGGDGGTGPGAGGPGPGGGGSGAGGIGSATFGPIPTLPRAQGSAEIPILEGKGD